MRFDQILQGVPADLADLTVTGVTCDSRQVQPGFAFFCIVGEMSDNRFAEAAVSAGAAVVVAEQDTGFASQFLVSDAHAAYARACANWFGNPADSLKLIGVTGTNGKTSVTYLLKAVLEAAGQKVGLIGTIQNMIGDEIIAARNTTPNAYELHSLFALMKKAGCGCVIMEVSSHALDQKRVGGLHFDCAVFTNLTQDHLDYHKTMERYLAAKRRLFEMCDTAVVNADDPYTARLLDGLPCRVLTYSTEKDDATYTAKNIVLRPDGVSYELVGYHIISRIRLQTVGRFSVYNSMAAAVCALWMGYDIATVSAALASVPGVKGRAEVVPTGRDFTVIIDYAHTPDGLQNILSTFRDCPKNRLVVLFGCGGDRDRKKRPLMGRIAARCADLVIVTSDNPRSEDPGAIIRDILAGMEGMTTPYVVVENRVEAIHYAVSHAQPGDILVLAGKGHETYQVLRDGTIHLDEREVVRDALSKL